MFYAIRWSFAICIQGADKSKSGGAFIRTFSQKDKSTKNHIIFTRQNKPLIFACSIAFICIIFTLLTREFNEIGEFYSLYIYRGIATVVGFAFGLVPYSVAQWIVLSVVVSLPFLLGIAAVKIAKSKDKLQTIAKILSGVIMVTCDIFIAFSLLCGFNYNRLPFAESTPYIVEKSTTQELYFACEDMAQKLSISGGEVSRINDIMVLSSTIPATAKNAVTHMENLSSRYNVLCSCYSPPKEVLFSRGMSHLGITGIYFPFTVEANVNTDVPAYSLCATMCHEAAHQAGFMREEEANFIAYLACTQSNDKDFVYSGNMLAFNYLSNALYEQDKNLYKKVYATIPSNIKADFKKNNNYWKQFEGPVQELSDNINNLYLQANNQTEGIKSYGMVTDLLIAKFKFEQSNK